MGRKKRKEYSSFAGLVRKDTGGSEPGESKDEKAGADRGWTLETADGTSSGEALPASRDRVRMRIDARPDAFGPMESGPPAYRDLDSDEMGLLASFGIRTVFPEDVLAEVRNLPEDPRPRDLEGREDLRDRRIFTIDGEDAKDFDDAISIEQRDDGTVEVGVHIADVGHYVRPGTAVDAEALARGTSVYLPDQVVPMLPEMLSNGLCSLVEGRDRLAYSVFMLFDAAGKRLEARVTKSVIRSVRRNTYAEVQALLDGESGLPKSLRRLDRDLRAFQRWTKTQQKLRDQRGSLRIQSSARKFVFDERGEVSAVIDAPRYFSNTLIEETALAANQAVGDLFRAKGLPTIYRVHPEKDPEEIEAVAKMLAEHGIRVPKKERLTGRDIGRMIRQARTRPNAEAMVQRIMGLVERAVYEVRGSDDVAEHFGLAREAYLHFTSPIRRYPDLIVHRWLFAVESRGEKAEVELAAEELLEDLNQTAAHASRQAEIAEMAEYAIGDLKVCQYLEPHTGKRFEATIRRISPAGIEVLLTDFNVTGFLPMRAIGERAKVQGPTVTVRRGRRNFSFSEGRPVRVKIRDVDFQRLEVRLELET
ncbi:MAG TPA: RNB domain-containing ribonuclease [Planctomycetes bacterium]|nr:RNB domain-containing ribonuclease [Planctomycetota bacterium]